MPRASISIPARSAETGRRCRASRASAPGLPAPGPGSCKAFCDQLVADRASIAQQHTELPTVLVFVPATDRHRFEFALIEQDNQPVAGLDAEVVLVVALGLRDFRCVDIRDPDLHAFEPDGIAIDNARPSVRCEPQRL